MTWRIVASNSSVPFCIGHFPFKLISSEIRGRFIAWEHLMMHEYMNNIDTFSYEALCSGRIKCCISKNGRKNVLVLMLLLLLLLWKCGLGHHHESLVGSHDFVYSRTVYIDTKRNQLKRWHYVPRAMSMCLSVKMRMTRTAWNGCNRTCQDSRVIIKVK